MKTLAQRLEQYAKDHDDDWAVARADAARRRVEWPTLADALAATDYTSSECFVKRPDGLWVWA